MKLIILSLFCIIFNLIKCRQSVNAPAVQVTGSLMCGGIPENRVKMFVSHPMFLNKFHFLNKKIINKYGGFSTYLKKCRLPKCSFSIEIIHQCRISNTKCCIKLVKTFQSDVFKKKIGKNNVYNIGIMDLKYTYPNQKFLCNKKGRINVC